MRKGSLRVLPSVLLDAMPTFNFHNTLQNIIHILHGKYFTWRVSNITSDQKDGEQDLVAGLTLQFMNL